MESMPSYTMPNYTWLAYMQMLDSALPVGGFAHSFGLETAVQEGRIRTLEQLKRYMSTVLIHSWAPCDAMGIKAVYEYAPKGEWERLWGLDRMLHVQRAAKESREGALKMGRRLFHLARSMYPAMEWEPLGDAIGKGRAIGAYPIVHAWIGWQLRVPLDGAAEGYLYSNTVMCVNSALRLMSMGQTEGQVIIASMLPLIKKAWEVVRAMDPDEFYSNTPQSDIEMKRHETLYSRLFMS